MTSNQTIHRTGIALAATLLTGACAGGADPTFSAEQSINSSSSCFNTAADISFNGGGRVKSPATYDHSTCPFAYLIDLNNYDASNVLGTQVAFDGTPPTTQAVCEATRVAAYVWSKSGTTSGTFLNSLQKSGAWVPDINGVSHCMTPTLNIEREIPTYRPGTGTSAPSYRIAVQARTIIDAARNATVQPVSIATVKKVPTRPVDVLTRLGSMGTLLKNTPAGVTDPNIQAMFNIRGSVTNNFLCRSLRLDRTLSQFSKQSFIRAGAPAQAATDRDTALDGIVNALCTSAGTVANLQTNIALYANAMSAMWNGMKAVAPRVPSANVANLLAATGVESLGVLVKRCGLGPRMLLSYVYDGTLPAGKTGDNLLLGSCSNLGSAAAVAQNLGVGVDFPGQTRAQARDKFNTCLVDSAGNDRCNDPRADGAPAEPTTPIAPKDPNDPQAPCFIVAENRQCTEGEAKALADFRATQAMTTGTVNQIDEQTRPPEVVTAAAKAMTQNLLDAASVFAVASAAIWRQAERMVVVSEDDQDAKSGMGETAAEAALVGAILGTGAALCNGHKEACGNMVLDVDQAGREIVAAAGRVKDAAAAANNFLLGRCTGLGCPDSGTAPNHMCAPDYRTGTAAWFQTDGPVGGSWEITGADRLNHCMCELLDSSYAGGATNGLTPAGCPSPDEKLRQDCLTNPTTPTDAPRPECLRALNPPASIDTWTTRICQQKDCAPNLMKMTFADGSCSCLPPLPPDAAQGLPCRAGSFAMCTDSDPAAGSCGCIPQTETPNGNDSLCRYLTNDATWPGVMDAFSVVDPKDVFATQFNATQRFAMIKPNKSIVSPTIYTRSLTALPVSSTSNPAALQVSTLVTKARPANSNIDLQIYMTSRDLPAGMMPLNHDFMGSVRLNAVPVGTPTDVTVPLNKDLLARAFSGKSLNIEYAIQAAGSRFVGVGHQAFTGAFTAVPLANQAQLCERPIPGGPLQPVTIPNPLAAAVGATPTVPAVFTLSTGQLALITDGILVLRPPVLSLP